MKKQSFITVLLFLTVTFGFSVFFLFSQDQAFSVQENRSLRQFPRFSWERIASGRFSEEINDYFADQFPARDLLVGVKGMIEIGLGKGENNGILLGSQGALARCRFDLLSSKDQTVQDTDGIDEQAIQSACNGINRLQERLDVPFTVLLTGRNIDVAPDRFSYPREISDRFLNAVRQAMNESVQTVDTIPVFRERSANGEQLYYKTDHHWTTKGAYLAYLEVLRAFGMEHEALPESAFEKRTVTTSFYGSLWSAGGMKWVEPDALELWLTGNEDSFEVIADGKAADGLYAMRWIAEKDCYSVFLDGVHDVVTVKRTDGEARPVLLLVKDSFANSLAPFLAQHFDLILLNLSSTRTDFTNVSERAEEYGADRVLFVYTLENLLTADKLSRLS